MSFPLFVFAQALTEFAPLIARLLKGEKGEKVAHKVVDVAHSITGEKDPLKVLQSLKADPKLIAQFQQTILQMEHELEMAEYKDRDSARLRDIALAQAGRSNLRADIMVISAALGLISCLVTIPV